MSQQKWGILKIYSQFQRSKSDQIFPKIIFELELEIAYIFKNYFQRIAIVYCHETQ